MVYMVTFTINKPPYTPFMLAYIPYMDPMGNNNNNKKRPEDSFQQVEDS